jgi:hypothetical protein
MTKMTRNVGNIGCFRLELPLLEFHPDGESKAATKIMLDKMPTKALHSYVKS